MPLGMEVGLSPGDFVLDGDEYSDHVYYSDCDFVRTLHSRYWLVQVQVQVLVLYAFYRVAQNKQDYLLLSSKFCISTTKHVPKHGNVRVAPKT